jgi:hypothetical protein
MGLKMEKENKYLRTLLIIKDNLKMEFDMEKAYFKITIDHIIKEHLFKDKCKEILKYIIIIINTKGNLKQVNCKGQVNLDGTQICKIK